MTKNTLKINDIVICGLFVALIAIGAFIKVPVPFVPFTLQTLFTTLAGLFLGGKKGFLCVFVYMILGLIGLPICFRRRSRIYFPAKLRLYNRLCRGSFSHRNNSPQESKSLLRKTVIRLFCRACNGLSFWNDLLLHNKQLLFGNRNRTLAAVSLLLSFGCSR